jgi:hypothetical protein
MGVYYAFDRATFTGTVMNPTWYVQTSVGGQDVPNAPISSSAWDSSTGTLYIAGGVPPANAGCPSRTLGSL